MRRANHVIAGAAHATPQRAAKGLSDRYRIHVIDRAAQILDCFGFDHQELSVSEIGAKTALHRSTAHRILMALEYNDLIRQNPETGKYRLGIKLFKLGHQAVSHLNLREICRPFLTRIMNETKETVHLAVLDEDQVLYLDKVEGPHAFTHAFSSRQAYSDLLHVSRQSDALLPRRTSGKRYFAQSGFDGHIPPIPLKPSNQLLADVRVVRKRGYAIDNEEIEIGLRCVGAPIRDTPAPWWARSACRTIGSFVLEKNIPVVGRLVMATAAEISIEARIRETD